MYENTGVKVSHYFIMVSYLEFSFFLKSLESVYSWQTKYSDRGTLYITLAVQLKLVFNKLLVNYT